ncbi:MAG TPA: nidogen-like domain-containing protein [Hypericibacter adhaerens]|uniref:nidogen-like domain-containing protein n=1 Tax=Hypericibacter adhaerens TaxID=2602016 RepID=UPI002CBC7F92|nr:nidogen-like domain-containing protein [Hypericibacter adhaerens]HWA45583.1 nidogen-like domain-containing protein [Hypericibacter adhaerens]
MAEGALGAIADPAVHGSGADLRAVQLAQAQGQPIGQVAAADGPVHVKHADGSEADLSVGGQIYADDTIRTAPDGGVHIRFADGTDFMLGGNAEVTIDKLIYDPAGSDSSMNLTVAGAFVFVTGSIAGAPGEGMTVNTPAGSIGVRGTSVGGQFSQTENGFLLALLRDIVGHVGHVVVYNSAGQVDLDELFEATILRNLQTPPQATFKLTLEQIQQLFGPLLQMDPDLDLQNESYERRTELENLIQTAAGGGGGGAFHSGGLNSAFLSLLFGALNGEGFDTGFGGLPGTALGSHPLDGTSLGNFEPPTPPSQPEQETLQGSEGNDTIIGTPGPDTLVGGPHNELILGEDSNDTILANGGNDTVSAGAGNDSIEGGPGNDSIDAGPGDDTALGGDGNDTLVGGPGNDSLSGENGNDSIVGSSGADRLDGGTGNDTVHGGDGNDSISGGDGNDVLLGGDTPAGGGGNGEDAPQLFAAAAATHELGTDGNALINGLGGPAGFGEGMLAPNDDGSTSFIDVSSVFPTGMNFFGTSYTGFYINNNGNITFASPLGTFTPFSLTGATSNPMIAPFFADVDTRGAHDLPPTPGGNSTGSNEVYYSLDPENGTIVITWDDVGYYGGHTDKLNAFQLVIQNTGDGNFSFEFRYENIDWTTGDASGGSGGLGGVVARAGWNSGDGSDFYELPQSGNQGEMLGLETTSNPGTDPDGNWVFNVVGGHVVGNDGDDTIDGGNGDDSILGGSGSDSLLGGADNDTLDGGSGSDRLLGGDGNDRLDGGGHDTGEGAGVDTLMGEGGNDTLVFGDADNVYDGGNGVDALELHQSVDFTQGPTGNHQGIEILDLRAAGAQAVTLNADDVLDLAHNNSTGETVGGHAVDLVVRGTAADSVDLSGTSYAAVATGVHLGAAYGGNAATYTVYQDAGGHDIAVESSVVVHTATT